MRLKPPAGSVKYSLPSGPKARSLGALSGIPSISVTTTATSPSGDTRWIDGGRRSFARHSRSTPPFWVTSRDPSEQTSTEFAPPPT